MTMKLWTDTHAMQLTSCGQVDRHPFRAHSLPCHSLMLCCLNSTLLETVELRIKSDQTLVSLGLLTI